MNSETAGGPVNRSPQTLQRSLWHRMDIPDAIRHELPHAVFWGRNVHDGQLRVLVDEEPWGWHLSISHIFTKKDSGRYPTWDEIADARYSLVPENIDMVMHLPPPSEYVALHDTTFHLYEHPERSGQ